MGTRIDTARLEGRHRAEFEKIHPEVVRLARRQAADSWELGRLLRRITDAALYAAAGYETFDDYIANGVKAMSVRQAATYKAISVFPRKDVEERGTSLFSAILTYWAVRPGQEDPAHVRSFRFPIVVNGRLEEHVLGDRELTEDRILDAAARLKREQAKSTSPLAAFLVRFIALLERAMRTVAGFSIGTRKRKAAVRLQFFAVPHDRLVQFWRALGSALAATDQLGPEDRACVLDLDARISPADSARASAPALPASDDTRTSLPSTARDERGREREKALASKPLRSGRGLVPGIRRAPPAPPEGSPEPPPWSRGARRPVRFRGR